MILEIDKLKRGYFVTVLKEKYQDIFKLAKDKNKIEDDDDGALTMMKTLMTMKNLMMTKTLMIVKTR